jgi:acetyltransferase-like isoleucine patch superfamily enzyme
VVLKDVPPWSVAVGLPARVVKTRRPDEKLNPTDEMIAPAAVLETAVHEVA